MAGQMENLGGGAYVVVQLSKREIQVPLILIAGSRTHGIPAAPLEHGEVHNLPDGDPPVRLTYHQVLQDPTNDQPETRRVVVR